MIWGLEGEDTTHRHRVDNEATQKHHEAPKATYNRPRPPAVQPVPPRFHQDSQKVGRGNEPTEPSSAVSAIQHQLMTPEVEFHPASVQPQIKLDSPEYHYPFPSHGPIDLSDFMRPRTELISDTLSKKTDFASNNAWDSSTDNLRSYGSTGDLNWQSLLLAQDRLRNSLPQSVYGSTQVNYMKPSGSSSSLSSLASSRSPIILDPPSQLARTLASQRSLSAQYSPSAFGTPLSTQGSSQRMSALEIARQYRQKQLLQQKQQLPTPPNSSSPLWSAGFSPYQGSLLSPEFISSARLPNLSTRDSEMQRLALLQQADLLQQLRSADHARLGISGREAQARISLLAPASQIQDHFGNTFDPSLASNISHRPPLGGLHVHPRQSVPSTTSVISPLLGVRQHPVQLHQPPSVTRVGVSSPVHGISDLVPPRSPVSPKQRSRNISQQNPRSIPLARLVQRLSSVPEEAPSVSPYKGRVPPGPPGPAGPAFSVQHNPKEGRASVRTKSLPLFADNEKIKRKPVGSFGSSTSRQGLYVKKSSETSHYATGGKAQGSSRTSHVNEGEGYASSSSTNADENVGTQREISPSRGRRGGHRGRGGRGWRARRPNAVNGPERSNGGLTVRS